MSSVFHLVAWVVLQRSDGLILLARRHGVSYGAGLWGLPGGHVDDHETLVAAAVRETFEEVGLSVDPAALELLGVTRYVDGAHSGVDFFYRARSWQGAPSAVAECSEIAWHSPENLPADSLVWLADALRIHLADGHWLDEHVASLQIKPAPT